MILPDCVYVSLITSEQIMMKVGKIDINYNGIETIQYSKVTYLGCVSEKIMS